MSWSWVFSMHILISWFINTQPTFNSILTESNPSLQLSWVPDPCCRQCMKGAQVLKDGKNKEIIILYSHCKGFQQSTSRSYILQAQHWPHFKESLSNMLLRPILAYWMASCTHIYRPISKKWLKLRKIFIWGDNQIFIFIVHELSAVQVGRHFPFSRSVKKMKPQTTPVFHNFLGEHAKIINPTNAGLHKV